MRFTIISNGTLISDEIAEYVKSTGRCNSFQVSIDGATSEQHDIFRGEGAFKKALTGLRCLLEHRIPATVRVTIHKHNVKELDQIAQFLLDDVGVPYFSTNNAAHMGLCRINKDEVQLTDEEYFEAMVKLTELSRKYDNRIRAAAGPLASSRSWKEMENARKQNENQSSEPGYLRGCGGIFNQLAVLADGTIVPCHQLSHIKLGSINKDSLRDIWVNHDKLQSLRNRYNYSLSNFENCKSCEYVPYCKGGCPGMAYILTGGENNPSPDGCYKAFLQKGYSLPFS